jgi:DUF3072 family protein
MANPKTDTGAGSNAEKNPDEWITGDEPMTGAQASYLKTLCEDVGETFDPNLSKAQASKLIDEVRARDPRPCRTGCTRKEDVARSEGPMARAYQGTVCRSAIARSGATKGNGRATQGALDCLERDGENGNRFSRKACRREGGDRATNNESRAGH